LIDWDQTGEDPEDAVYVGWNHDYVGVGGEWKWRMITMMGPTGCVPRYHPCEFASLFTTDDPQACNKGEDPVTTPLYDTDVCDQPPALPETSESAPPSEEPVGPEEPSSASSSSSSSETSTLPPCQ